MAQRVLSNCIFKNTNLTEATFTGIVGIEDCVFEDVSMNNAKLEGVDLSDNNTLTRVEMTGADLSGCVLPEEYHILSFAGARLGGDPADTDKHARLDLSNNTTNLIGLSFLDASFNNVDLSGSDLSGAILSQTGVAVIDNNRRDLVKAAIMGANNGSMDISLVNLDYTVLHDMSFGAVPGGSTLQGAVVKFSEMGLGGKLFRTDFSGSDLRGAVFDGLNVEGCNFSNCDLTEAKFIGCTLTKNCWEGANITEIDISGATVNYEVFTGLCGTAQDVADEDLEGYNTYYQVVETEVSPAGAPLVSTGWETIFS